MIRPRHIRFASYLVAVLSLLLPMSCDSTADDVPTADVVPVTLRINVEQSSAAQPASRAAFDDPNSDEGEMMRNWTVVITSADGMVERILSSSGYAGEREEDSYSLTLPAGTHNFYTFANLSLADVGLGSIAVGGTLPANFESSTFVLSANKAAAADFAGGMPMTNKQTVTLARGSSSAVRTVQLYAVRMPVKLQINITNVNAESLTLKEVALADVTTNGVRVPLLPTASGASAHGIAADNMACAYEVSDDAPATETISFSPNEELAQGQTKRLTAYVNPSKATSSQDGHFLLSITTESTGHTVTRRVRLDWSEMARNDLRIIPVSLSDYRLMFEPQQFTAIGVLPPTVTDLDDLLSVNFHWYGEFHITPYIEQISTGTRYTGDVAYAYDKSQTLEGDMGIFRTYEGTSTPMLYWDDHTTDGTPRLEGELADHTGSVMGVVTANVILPDGKNLAIRRRFRISMTAVDWSQMAIRLRALRRWKEPYGHPSGL